MLGVCALSEFCSAKIVYDVGSKSILLNLTALLQDLEGRVRTLSKPSWKCFLSAKCFLGTKTSDHYVRMVAFMRNFKPRKWVDCDSEVQLSNPLRLLTVFVEGVKHDSMIPNWLGTSSCWRYLGA